MEPRPNITYTIQRAVKLHMLPLLILYTHAPRNRALQPYIQKLPAPIDIPQELLNCLHLLHPMLIILSLVIASSTH